jgi:3-methylcrotonyl-CoA carboxylase alpha subunit
VKLFVANRGEIARRVIRTAKKMGWTTVVGYAPQDADLPFVKEADESVCYEGEEASETYLNTDKVLAAAKALGATHLHPGYGFLSEKPEFVEAVVKAGVKFVGPSPQSMKALGDKISSRRFLAPHQIPLLPAYDGDDQSLERLQAEALKLEFPLLIKPSAGGGGKGMVKVYSAAELVPGIESARRVAQGAFGDPRLYLERLVEPARHIEVQILADEQGHVLALGERECSLQRRHQKVFEETPSFTLSEEVRKRVLEASVRVAQAAQYVSAGTVEWIWDGKDGIYFLEVNARLQVEHPVTELRFGIDLVEWQLRVAQGESVAEIKLSPKGHAIEARLCAEDPAEGFLPSAGKIHRLRWPQGIRIDAGFEEKNIVPSQFDSLLAKLIAYAPTREEAIIKLRLALETLRIMGPKTNRGFLIQCLKDPRVLKSELSTALLAEISPHVSAMESLDILKRLHAESQSSAIGETEADADADWYSPWGALPRPTKSLDYEDFGETRYVFLPHADFQIPRPRRHASVQVDHALASLQLKSPMPAKVVKVLAAVGQSVKKGEAVVVLEAMKMEHQLKATADFVVKVMNCAEGDRVMQDQILVEWEAS